MREELLAIIEKNSRIDLKELAVILGVEEIDVVNELAALEAEGIICGYHTLINWEKTYIEKVRPCGRYPILYLTSCQHWIPC